MKKLAVATVSLLLCSTVHAVTLGSQVIKAPMTVGRIYQGHSSAVYATFLGQTMTGCIGNGGYLTPSWVAGGAINDETTNRMLSVLLMAKAQNLTFEVRYRVNSEGTGWNKCTIDGFYLF